MSNYVLKPRVRSVPTTTRTPYWTRSLQVARARYHRGERVSFSAANRKSVFINDPVKLAARAFGVHAAVAKRDPVLQDLSEKFSHYVIERDNCFAAFHVLKGIEARCKSLR